MKLERRDGRSDEGEEHRDAGAAYTLSKRANHLRVQCAAVTRGDRRAV